MLHTLSLHGGSWKQDTSKTIVINFPKCLPEGIPSDWTVYPNNRHYHPQVARD